MIKKTAKLLAIILLATLSSQSAVAAELQLVCPCKAERIGQTAVEITAGIENIGETTSGELRIYLGSAPSIPIDYQYFRSFVYYPDTLTSGNSVPAGTTKTGAFRLPPSASLDSQGRTHLLLTVQEKVSGEWETRDQVRLSPKVMFPVPKVGGESRLQRLYFIGKPSIETVGSEAIVRIPEIRNSGPEPVTISLIWVGHFESEEFYDQQGRYGLNAENLSYTVGAFSSLSSIEIRSNYTPPASDRAFTNIIVRSEVGTELWETIEARDGNAIPSYPFSVSSIAFLEDTDRDGVSDFNETLMGTDADDVTSTPATLVLDVMATYTPGASSFFNGEPEVRILHELEWANQSLANSNVDARFRLVDSRPVNPTDSLNIHDVQSAAQAQTGSFDGIDAIRESVGADLLVTYIEDDTSDGLCGVGTNGGFGKEGDRAFNPRAQIASTVAAGCRTHTLTHEFGHNLGLGHGVLDPDSNRGAFFWSRGHGENGWFGTIMTSNLYDFSGGDLQYFSNPSIICPGGTPCGVSRQNAASGADAALSIRTVMYQASQLTASVVDTDGDGPGNNFDNCPNDANQDQLDTDQDGLGDACDEDDDNDGVLDSLDAFPLDPNETTDTDGDGIGDNSDQDADGDGVNNDDDAFPLDASEQVDSDGDGIGDNSDAFPETAIVRGTQFLQTTSASANITGLHVLNTSDREQSFRALMYDGSGDRVGGVPLIGDPVPPMGRLVLTSEDIEGLFRTEPWQGPAMLEIRGESTFDVMSKLISPSGLISNTNCVRQDRVLNIEGFDSTNRSYVRFISTRNNNNVEITGTLHDANGNVVGNADSVLISRLAPNQQVWINRDDFAELVGAEWNGEAMLEVNKVNGLKLLNLNYITDEQTFFNFSCFESSDTGRIYLQTTSTSQNVSLTHLVNTADTEQQLTGTLYGSDGVQVGLANQPLHSGTIPPKGRVIISSEDIETAFNISPWLGPAMLEVSGTDSFELMTKLTSPSGLISNTNCVRQDQVHNIGGFDQTDVTYVRFINIGDTVISNVRGSLYDTSGNVIGATNPVLIDVLPAKAHVWRNRNQLSDLIGDTWNGTVSLKIDNADDNLRLLNLNYINSETFFNFSCYETGQ